MEAIFPFVQGANFAAEGRFRKFPQIKISFGGYVFISRKGDIEIYTNYTGNLRCNAGAKPKKHEESPK